MSKEEQIEVDGVVAEALRDGHFKVRLSNGHDVMCHLSGKIRMNGINILPEDEVTVEMSPYDLTRGRIVYRHD